MTKGFPKKFCEQGGVTFPFFRVSRTSSLTEHGRTRTRLSVRVLRLTLSGPLEGQSALGKGWEEKARTTVVLSQTQFHLTESWNEPGGLLGSPVHVRISRLKEAKHYFCGS